jgi:hypothetical protein
VISAASSCWSDRGDRLEVHTVMDSTPVLQERPRNHSGTQASKTHFISSMNYNDFASKNLFNLSNELQQLLFRPLSQTERAEALVITGTFSYLLPHRSNSKPPTVSPVLWWRLLDFFKTSQHGANPGSCGGDYSTSSKPRNMVRTRGTGPSRTSTSSYGNPSRKNREKGQDRKLTTSSREE